MKIPKTTAEKPLIEYIFFDNGKIQLQTSNDWWGKHGFKTSGGLGNTCLPKDLEKSIKRFKEQTINNINREILILEKRKVKLTNTFLKALNSVAYKKQITL